MKSADSFVQLIHTYNRKTIRGAPTSRIDREKLHLTECRSTTHTRGQKPPRHPLTTHRPPTSPPTQTAHSMRTNPARAVRQPINQTDIDCSDARQTTISSGDNRKIIISHRTSAEEQSRD